MITRRGEDVVAHAMPTGSGTWTIYVQRPAQRFPGERCLSGVVAQTSAEALGAFVQLLEQGYAALEWTGRVMPAHQQWHDRTHELIAWAQAVEREDW